MMDNENEVELLVAVTINGIRYQKIIFDQHWEKHRGQAGLNEAKVLGLLLNYIDGHEFLPQRSEEDFDYYAFEIFDDPPGRGYTLVLAIDRTQNEEVWVYTCHPDKRVTNEQEERKEKATKQGRHQLPSERYPKRGS